MFLIILSVIRERNVVSYNQGSWGSKKSSNLPRSNSKSVTELVGNTLVSLFLIQEFPHQMILPPGSAFQDLLCCLGSRKALEEQDNPARNGKPPLKPCPSQDGTVINHPQMPELVLLKLLRIFKCIKESSLAFRDIIGSSGLLQNSAGYPKWGLNGI